MADNDFGLSETEEATRMAENGMRLVDEAEEIIEYFLAPDVPFLLTPSLIQRIQRIACVNIKRDAGDFRKGPVRLVKRKHVPPDAFLVPSLVVEMCDFVNDNFHERTAFNLSALIMWRLNWIHPFSDGNGRTSRTLSYIILCVRLGYRLPGTPTIPAQIEMNRDPYFDALADADEGASETASADFSAMENLLRDLLAKQLLSVVAAGDGSSVDQLISE